MATKEEIRIGVIKSLPEIQEIKDKDLRNKVIDAWTLALFETEYASLEDMVGAADVDRTPLEGSSSQATHMRAVARMCIALVDAFETSVGSLHLDRDHMLAAALLHDVGKPYEWSAKNRIRWRSDIPNYGFPGLRHPIYGAHIAISVGLPEDIVHAIAAHCVEGNSISRNLEATIAFICDYAFWDIASRAGMLGTQVAGPFSAGSGRPEI